MTRPTKLLKTKAKRSRIQPRSVIQFRVREDLKAAFERAIASDGLTMSEFFVEVMKRKVDSNV